MSGSFRISIVTRCVLSLVLAAVPALAWAGAPHLVLDINTQFAALDSNPVWLGQLGNRVYFIARPVPATSTVTDGTSDGTHMVADVSPGPGGGVTTLLGLIGTDLIFAEQPSANTMQVYRPRALRQ